MKHRTARFVAVLFAVLGLTASMAPPAHAIVIQNVVFTGVFSTTNGMSYPCVTGKNPSPPAAPQFDPAKCPPNKPNTAAWSFFGQAVTGTAKVAKTKCLITDIACLQVSTTTISGSGTVRGNCSHWSGSGWWSSSEFDVINTKESQNSTTVLEVSWLGVAGINVLSGTARRNGGPSAPVVGSFQSAPDPTVGSCWDKRPKTWVVAGAYSVIWPNF